MTPSVVCLFVAMVLLFVAAIMAIWPHPRQPMFGWAGLFFLALAFFISGSHVFGWA
jgi:uncharacterized membrane protein